MTTQPPEPDYGLAEDETNPQPPLYVPPTKTKPSLGTIIAIIILVFGGMGGPCCWWLSQIIRYGF